MGKHHREKKAARLERAADRMRQSNEARSQNRSQTIKKSIIYSVLGVIIIAIIINLLQNVSVPTEELDELSLTQTAPNDVVRGNNPDILLIEYSDFQCPACRAANTLVESVLEQYGDNITFVYRHFPLKQIHPKATLAAQAVEAAANQNKFWEMHMMLFERQNDWTKTNERDAFAKYASELGIDVEQFKTDLDSTPIRAKVQDHYEDALNRNLRGTPTFFLNGLQITVSGEDDLKRRIDALLQ